MHENSSSKERERVKGDAWKWNRRSDEEEGEDFESRKLTTFDSFWNMTSRRRKNESSR